MFTKIVEQLLLKSRYILVFFYLAILWQVVVIGYDFVNILRGLDIDVVLREHTLRTLELLDITMIVNLVWFVSAGIIFRICRF